MVQLLRFEDVVIKKIEIKIIDAYELFFPTFCFVLKWLMNLILSGRVPTLLFNDTTCFGVQFEGHPQVVAPLKGKALNIKYFIFIVFNQNRKYLVIKI